MIRVREAAQAVVDMFYHKSWGVTSYVPASVEALRAALLDARLDEMQALTEGEYSAQYPPATWRQALGDDPRPDAGSSLDRLGAADDIARMAREAHRELVTEDYPGHAARLDPWTMRLIERFADLITAANYDACALICEQLQDWPEGATPYDCAAAIRAGKKP